MKHNDRPQRVGDEIRRILSDTLLRKVSDPRIAGVVSLTAVTMSGDLSQARVFFSVLDETKRETVAQGLNKAKPFLRRELGQQLRLRKVPQLSFCEDRTIVEAQAMDRLIDQVMAKTKTARDEAE